MAKKLKIPEDRPLTEAEYEKLTTHLRNSMVWYAMNGRGSFGLIEEKLLEKEVPRAALPVKFALEGVREVNLWDESMQFLRDNMLVDEESFAVRIVEKEVAKGRGKKQIKSLLWQKKIPSELADKVLEEFFEDDWNEQLVSEGLAKALRQAEGSSPFRKAVEKKNRGEFASPSPRQVVIQKMAMRGFSFDEVNDYLDFIEWTC